MADLSDLVAGMSTLDLQGAQAITMASLKSILRKTWLEDGCVEAPATATDSTITTTPTTPTPTSTTCTSTTTTPRKVNVSFGDVLARDGEDGKVVPPSTRSRDEWMKEVNARRGASLIEKFRGLEQSKDDDACCQVTLVENVADDGFGREVVLYEVTSFESDDDESDEDTEVESESESDDEDGGAEKIEVIFECDSDSDSDSEDDDDDDDGDEEEEEDKDEMKQETKGDEAKEQQTKGQNDSMEYARTFLQSEIGSGFRYPMCQPATVL